jgi:hypothetical protein
VWWLEASLRKTRKERDVRIFAVAPIASKALQALRRDGWSFGSTGAADRGDGYCRLVKHVPKADLEKLEKAGITAWAERRSR